MITEHNADKQNVGGQCQIADGQSQKPVSMDIILIY